MARQRGLFTFTGGLSNVNGYKFKGLPGFFVRTNGGADASSIFNNVEFERTRENMREFGGSSKAAKALRDTLAQWYKDKTLVDVFVSGRLTAVFVRICQVGLGVRGQRLISVQNAPELLEGFQLNKNKSFNTTYNGGYTATISVSRNSADLALPAFIPNNVFDIPNGATHFRFGVAIEYQTEYQWDAVTQEYQSNQPAFLNQSDITYTAQEPLDAAYAGGTITATIGGIPPANVAAVQTILIEFYQLVNGDFYKLAENNAAQVANVD